MKYILIIIVTITAIALLVAADLILHLHGVKLILFCSAIVFLLTYLVRLIQVKHEKNNSSI